MCLSSQIKAVSSLPIKTRFPVLKIIGGAGQEGLGVQKEEESKILTCNTAG
jgi:hypothetical protein